MMTKMIGNDNGESDDCSDDYGDRDDGGQWPWVQWGNDGGDDYGYSGGGDGHNLWWLLLWCALQMTMVNWWWWWYEPQ